MKNTPLIALAALLAFTPLSAAQTSQNQTAPNQNQPGQRQQGQRQPNPAFALVRAVDGIAQLDQNPNTALTKAQAQKMLPILRSIQADRTLNAASVARYSAQLQAILTPVQRTALADQRGPGGGFGGRGGFSQNGGGQNGNGNTQGAPGQGPRGGQGFVPSGNPFTQPQGRGAQILSALITTLSQRTR